MMKNRSSVCLFWMVALTLTSACSVKPKEVKLRAGFVANPSPAAPQFTSYIDSAGVLSIFDRNGQKTASYTASFGGIQDVRLVEDRVAFKSQANNAYGVAFGTAIVPWNTVSHPNAHKIRMSRAYGQKAV